jgi:hypothetical protein
VDDPFNPAPACLACDLSEADRLDAVDEMTSEAVFTDDHRGQV